MAYKVKVRFQDGNEEIELIEKPYDNNGALLYHYHDSEGNYLRFHLSPYKLIPAHSLHFDLPGLLGDRFVNVSEITEN